MININIVYDNMYNEADIIAIPDEIFDKLDIIVKEFIHWQYWESPKDDCDYWTIINGKKCTVLETKGFVKWLNNRFFVVLQMSLLNANGVIIQDYNFIKRRLNNFEYSGLNAYHQYPLMGINDTICRELTKEQLSKKINDNQYMSLEFISDTSYSY